MMPGTASSVVWLDVLLVKLEIMLFVRDVFQGFTWKTADASVILLRIK